MMNGVLGQISMYRFAILLTVNIALFMFVLKHPYHPSPPNTSVRKELSRITETLQQISCSLDQLALYKYQSLEASNMNAPPAADLAPACLGQSKPSAPAAAKQNSKN